MPEPSRDKDITPIDLRDVHRSTQLGQIPITQLERREPNALETNGINRQPEREVGSALRHQEVSRDLFCIAGEKSVEPPLGSGAQGDVLHMAADSCGTRVPRCRIRIAPSALGLTECRRACITLDRVPSTDPPGAAFRSQLWSLPG